MKIAIIDQQHIFREGLERLIEVEADVKIVASIPNVSELTEEQIEEIDLFLIDIKEIENEKKFINQHILKNHKHKKLVALSNDTNKPAITEAVLAGCHGFLLKEMSYPSFIKAVRTIFEEGGYIHPQVLRHLIDDYRDLSKANNGAVNRSNINKETKRICTSRENEILQLLVNGHDNNSIAEQLSISEKTVKNHLTNIFRKLNVKDRTQAAVLAIRNNWVEF